MIKTYCNIFTRLGLNFRSVAADSGSIGGSISHEFHALADSGEDEIVFICNDKHLEETNMRDVLKKLRPDCSIISMPVHKYGPVYTVQRAYDFIDDD